MCCLLQVFTRAHEQLPKNKLHPHRERINYLCSRPWQLQRHSDLCPVFTDAHLGEPLPADASPGLCVWRSENLFRVNQSRGFSCICPQHRSSSKKASYMTASPAFIFFPPATQSRQQTVPTPVLCHHRRWPALWRCKYKTKSVLESY